MRGHNGAPLQTGDFCKTVDDTRIADCGITLAPRLTRHQKFQLGPRFALGLGFSPARWLPVGRSAARCLAQPFQILPQEDVTVPLQRAAPVHRGNRTPE